MATEGQSPEEVSGQAAFWILASLAAAAVVLPSTSSRMTDRDLFGGNIDLARCIPGVSLLDGICDLVFLCICTHRVLREPKPVQRVRRALPKFSVVAAKLMLSIFTVSPQTIKAFSLKGVPATQFCAFVFFFASTTRLLIDLCGLEPEEPYTPPDAGGGQLHVIILLVLLFQAPFQLWIWHNIIISVKFQLSDAFYYVCSYSSLVCSLLLIAQLIIWLLYVASRRRFDFSALPYVVPVRAFWLVIISLTTVLRPDRNEDHQSESRATFPGVPYVMDKLAQSAGSMICAILLSIIIAKALNLVGRLFVLQPDTAETTEALVEAGELSPADDSQQDTEAVKEEEQPPVEQSGSRLGRLGVTVDRWLIRFLLMDTTADVSITLTVFNLITTVLYYLVYFDGTGTVNPEWTSVLG